jgi:hypothetical protein
LNFVGSPRRPPAVPHRSPLRELAPPVTAHEVQRETRFGVGLIDELKKKVLLLTNFSINNKNI